MLSKTQLNTQGCIQIINSLGPQIETFDISNNPEIEMPAYKLLCELLESETYKLFARLELEGNQLGDQNMISFLEGLKFNTSLKLLNISQNNISDLGARAVKHYIRSNSNLRVLYMRWNSLGVKGSKRIAKALTTNTVLQVLDISFC